MTNPDTLAGGVKLEDREFAITAAAQAFCNRGITIACPWEGDLDDEERERFDALVAAIDAYNGTIALAALPATGAVPIGWKLVPVEPTDAQLLTQGRSRPDLAKSEREAELATALNEAVRRSAADIYREMVAASPPSPSGGEPEPVAEPFLTGRGWENLSCDDQFTLATQIAANIGYDLIAEPEHPDSPHNTAHTLASPPKPSEAMVDLLAELAKHPGWELSQGYDGANEDFSDYGWCVHEVSGGANDRVWELVGFGETPAQALTAALSGGAK